MTMIPLDDPKWLTLQGGYRIPYNPCSALKKIEDNEDVNEAYEELWDELHHQGDVGEASYAAVPHLVRIQKNKEADWNMYALVSTIEIERHKKSNPPLPEWLTQPYHQAWLDIVDIAIRDLKVSKDPLVISSTLGALALAKHELKLGVFISYADESEIDEVLEDHYSWSELYSDPE